MIIAVIQARMASIRLPGKALLELPKGSGISVIARIIQRLKKCRLVEQVIIATTENPEDIEIWKIAIGEGAGCFFGSIDRDVLKDFYEIARGTLADVIVRITGDCPLIRPDIVDKLIRYHSFLEDDITYNTRCEDGDIAGDGRDVEVISFTALAEANEKAKSKHDREHVTPWIRRNLKSTYIPILDFNGCSLNTEADYERICKIYAQR